MGNEKLIDQLEQSKGFLAWSPRGMEERRRVDRFIKSLKEYDSDEVNNKGPSNSAGAVAGGSDSG